MGIDFTGKADRYPNTLPAHALMDYAATKSLDKQNELAEALFQVSVEAGYNFHHTVMFLV